MPRLAASALAGAIIFVCAVGPAQGTPSAGKSVVGGGLVAPGSLPSTVSIRFGDGLCTGSVVAPTTVVTAAHCLRRTPASQIFVRANTVSSFAGGEVLGVTAAVPHPGFKLGFNGIINDIAILKLATPTTATPIALPTAAEGAALSPPGATMAVAGFGRSNPGLDRPSRLGQLRSAAVYTRTACRAPSYRSFTTETMVCASGAAFVVARSGRKRRQVQRATCFGDSGGPLLADTPTGPRLLGVTSYGGIYPFRFSFVACGLRGFPDVYTRVSAHLPFIQPYL